MGYIDLESREVKTDRLIAVGDSGVRGMLTAFVCVPLLAACVQPPQLPAPLATKKVEQGSGASAPAARTGKLVEAIPTPQLVQPPARGPVMTPPAVRPGDEEPSVLNLEQVSIPSFVQIVLAEVGRRNVVIEPQVVARRELITFRSAPGQSREQIEMAGRLLLKTYGIAVIDVGGLVRVMPDNQKLGNLPEIRRGAALPETPLPLRPVFHLVDLQAVRQVEVTSFLRTLFGDRITVQEDAGRNALLISGTPDNVQAALDAIRVLDQPQLVGGRTLSLTPRFTSSEEFARRLYDVLVAQGYSVQPVTSGPLSQGGIRYPILVLPVSGMNAVFVFARGEQVIRHIETLAATLDRPNEQGGGRNFFTYQVRHKDAAVLAETMEMLMSGVRARAATPAAGGAAAPAARGNVVVDRSSNSLIFQASQDEYSQLLGLMQRLDQPARSAIIEVTVAELLLDDSTQMGVEWLASFDLGGGRTGTASTLGGLAVGQGGLNVRLLNAGGQVRAVVNALASDNKANILSSPRVMARSGEVATIQVGQEVPIITSQATGNLVGNNQTQLVQTIQYRSTGVILKVKPVIHSDDQIDLDLAQEVSAASQTETGVNSSPTFSTRRLDTKLTLRNGSTVLLGGLISDERSDGNAGIPLLKDIPLIGSAFSKKSFGARRRELVMLITPYVISNSQEAEELTRAFRGMLQPWLKDGAAGVPSAAGSSGAPGVTVAPTVPNVPVPPSGAGGAASPSAPAMAVERAKAQPSAPIVPERDPPPAAPGSTSEAKEPTQPGVGVKKP